MTLEEKKQVYLDKFHAIISKRMADQFDPDFYVDMNYNLPDLISVFRYWDHTEEDRYFWGEIYWLYFYKTEIEHQQLLDIFHKHNIKP